MNLVLRNDNGIDEESEFNISLYRSWHVSCWELVHIFLSVCDI